MPLNAIEMIWNGHLRSADIRGFYDLLVGNMYDQPVTLRNTLTVGLTVFCQSRLSTNGYNDTNWPNSLGGNCLVNGVLWSASRLVTNGWDAGSSWPNSLGGNIITSATTVQMYTGCSVQWSDANALRFHYDGTHGYCYFWAGSGPAANTGGRYFQFRNSSNPAAPNPIALIDHGGIVASQWCHSQMQGGNNAYQALNEDSPGGVGNCYRWESTQSVDHAVQYKLRADPLPNALGIVNAITGYSYEHIALDANNKLAPRRDARGGYITSAAYGFKPSEVEKYLPELVGHHWDTGEPWAVDLGRMVVVLWEAVKTLSAQLDMLQDSNGRKRKP